MVDAEVARRRLREMDRRLGALADLRSRGSEVFLADAGVQAQVERHLQLAIQAAIDIAVHVLAEDSPSTPETYGAAFTALAEMEVIPTDLAAALGRAAGLRNILVHAYLDVDPERLWDQLADVDDLRAFAGDIESYLASS